MTVVTAGCENVTGPDRGDPAQYAFADSVRYACGDWSPAAPPEPLGLFDIPGGRGDETEGWASARRRLTERVLDAGGTIVHQYNIVMVRAIVPTAAVPTLPTGWVYGVVDARSLDVRVFVRFRGQIARAAIEARGGQVLSEYAALGMVYALLPDHAIPALRLDRRVEFVEGGLVGACLH